MEIKSVNNKISLGVGVCVLVTALIIIWFAVSSLRSSSTREAREKSLNIARVMVADVENHLNSELQVAQTLSETLATVKTDDIKLNLDRNKVKDILRTVLENNPQLFGIFTCWEANGFDGNDAGFQGAEYHDASGRFALYLRRDDKGRIEVLPLLTLPGRVQDGQPGAWYTDPAKSNKSYLSDPFAGTAGGSTEQLITLTSPILANNKFFGVIGVDLNADFVQKQVDDLQKSYGKVQASIVSYNGILAGVSGSPDLAGQHLKALHPDFEEDLAQIRTGEEVNMVMDEQLETYVPIRINGNENPWSANITVPLSALAGDATSAMWKMTIIGLACVALALFLLRYITAGVVGPLEQVVDLAAGLAEGDLSKRLNIHQDDEIGTLAVALDQSCSSLSAMIREITTNAEMQASAAQEMSTVSAQLAATSEEMNVQAESVAGATEEMSVSINAMASASEEMSVNIQSVSSTAEQMSQNMNSIASSVEQMSTSIEDVALSARDGSIIARQAMEMSGSATTIMDILGKAAKEIGEVTSLIKRIADQTNLLALNATIEAASAGDAGKGFAVVANEIKELANQSGQAANEIAKRVKGVQGNANSAVEAIINITDIIQRMNDASSVISKSVEEQTSTALEISDSVQQATAGITNIATSIAELARGATDVSKSAAEAARGVTEVSANIQGLSRAASESNSGAQQVNTTAAELARISSQLREVAGRFKVTAAD
ncbi:MAG: methyl-accepting chemotaxis protein [Desulfobulbaceae bacterium]